MEKNKLKKIEHVWSIICSSSSIDADKNNITLFNVIERMQFNSNGKLEKIGKESAKLINTQFELVSLWKKSDFEDTVSIKGEAVLIDPRGEKMASLEFPIEIKNPARRLRTRLQFDKIMLTVSGDYIWQIKVKMDGGEYVVNEVPLEIEII